MEPRYIFIVGLPRTGSKLVENVLKSCRHIDFQSSGETKYVGHLLTPAIRHKIKKIGDMSKDENIHKLIEYFYTGTPNRGYWRHLRQGRIQVDKEAFLEALLASDRTEKGIFEVILRIHTTVTDKTILADKTNPHLYHVATLLDWFPEAKIIHLFRDPRAIIASHLNKTGTLLEFSFIRRGNPVHTVINVLHLTFTWLYAIRLHRKYQKRYPQNYTFVKFEDLISNPKPTITRLCKFLEIEFDAQMLSPRQLGSSFAKEPVVGFDSQTLNRWEKHLDPWMKVWIQVCTKKYLREFGYIK